MLKSYEVVIEGDRKLKELQIKKLPRKRKLFYIRESISKINH